MEWEFEPEKNPPEEPGWYPILVCYDPQEGLLPAAAYWDGDKWEGELVRVFCKKKCNTDEEAISLAYEHNPDA